MDWWSSFVDWTGSDRGWQVISDAVIPFVAIVVAGVVAALIGRSATKRVVALQEREARNAAVAGIVSAARKAATWGSLGHDERAYADHLAEDADIRLRLLPVAGSPIAANWAQHEIADIKRNSSTFSFQAEQSLAEFRDRMLEWQARPSRARKLFRYDLERWKFEAPDPDADLINRQQVWNADQVSSTRGRAPGAPAEGTTSAPTSADTMTAITSSTSDADTQHAVTRQTDAPHGDAPRGRAAARGAVDRPETPRDDDHQTVDEPDTPRDLRPAQAGTSGDGRAEPAGETRALTSPKVDAAAPAAGTSTTSVPTRVTDAPAEFADPHETDEAPYGAPVSASELRRRGAEDDE
jgi:hypothetical protein